MPALSVKQRRAMAIAEHHPDQLYGRNKSLLGMSHQQLHDFASTPEKGLPVRAKKTRHVDLGQSGGFTIKHPGAFRRAAQKRGKSTREFAQEEKSAPGKLGRQARSAMGLMAMHKRRSSS